MSVRKPLSNLTSQCTKKLEAKTVEICESVNYEATLLAWMEWNQPEAMPSQEVIDALSYITHTHQVVIKAWLERHILM